MFHRWFVLIQSIWTGKLLLALLFHSSIMLVDDGLGLMPLTRTFVFVKSQFLCRIQQLFSSVFQWVVRVLLHCLTTDRCGQQTGSCKAVVILWTWKGAFWKRNTKKLVVYLGPFSLILRFFFTMCCPEILAPKFHQKWEIPNGLKIWIMALVAKRSVIAEERNRRIRHEMNLCGECVPSWSQHEVTEVGES